MKDRNQQGHVKDWNGQGAFEAEERASLPVVVHRLPPDAVSSAPLPQAAPRSATEPATPRQHTIVFITPHSIQHTLSQSKTLVKKLKHSPP